MELIRIVANMGYHTLPDYLVNALRHVPFRLEDGEEDEAEAEADANELESDQNNSEVEGSEDQEVKPEQESDEEEEADVSEKRGSTAAASTSKSRAAFAPRLDASQHYASSSEPSWKTQKEKKLVDRIKSLKAWTEALEELIEEHTADLKARRKKRNKGDPAIRKDKFYTVRSVACLA